MLKSSGSCCSSSNVWEVGVVFTHHTAWSCVCWSIITTCVVVLILPSNCGTMSINIAIIRYDQRLCVKWGDLYVIQLWAKRRSAICSGFLLVGICIGCIILVDFLLTQRIVVLSVCIYKGYHIVIWSYKSFMMSSIMIRLWCIGKNILLILLLLNKTSSCSNASIREHWYWLNIIVPVLVRIIVELCGHQLHLVVCLGILKHLALQFGSLWRLLWLLSIQITWVLSETPSWCIAL